MHLEGICAVVTGGASGLGLASARELVDAGSRVAILDLQEPSAADRAALGDAAIYVEADVTDEASMTAALDKAESALGPVRALVHCAGRGGDRTRILDTEGRPGPLDSFQEVIRINLIGTYNALRLAAARMSRNEPVAGERGAIVLTSSVAGYEGQIGQTSYSASKAGVRGMTLVAARDLASRFIRVNTIAPGVFDTPMLSRLREDIRAALAAAVPHPSRLGTPADFGQLAVSILRNGYLNGETIRLDGAMRMPPR